MRFISNQLLVKFRREKVIGGITAIARVTANDFCSLTFLFIARLLMSVPEAIYLLIRPYIHRFFLNQQLIDA